MSQVNLVQIQASELCACEQDPEQLWASPSPLKSRVVKSPLSEGCENALSECTLRRVSGEGAGKLHKKARPSALPTGNQQASSQTDK